MMGKEEEVCNRGSSSGTGVRKTFWRSASWSARSPSSDPNPSSRNRTNPRLRPSLPPLKPLSVARRLCVDEWPRPGSDDLGDNWCSPATPARRDEIAFRDRECSHIEEHLYLGSEVAARDRQELRRHGITHVLNCAGFVCPEYFRRELSYRTLWLHDNPAEDITSVLYDVFDYLEEVREARGRVLVHCRGGVSRSSALIIAYLMWRRGQNFEEALCSVKAARGATDPNMGFASQLLQCQKRVHAAPISPTSVLRIHRIAPQSAYDPLHLVPKLVHSPSAKALDSRGAFLVHVPSAIFVWIGSECSARMAERAAAAASQVLRYERPEGPIVEVREGKEPTEFRDALSVGQLFLDGSDDSYKEQIDGVLRIGVGCKREGSYDLDFEIFQRANSGGVLPSIPFLGIVSETRLPTRETGWCRLKRELGDGVVRELVDPSLNELR